MCIAFGICLALVFAFRHSIEFGVDPDSMVDVILIGIVLGIVSARAYYVAMAPFKYESIWEMIAIRDGGLAIYGGIIGGFLFGGLACKRRGVPVLPMFDLTAMGFLLGQGCGRWGNFFNQEAFGCNTTLPWGMFSETTRAYLMGKRQLGELQPEELVSTILISNLASISIESEEVPITSSLIPLFLIAALELLGSVLSFRSQKFFNFLSGRPKTVILDGQIDQKALRMLRLTTADLMEALRGKNIFDPREVSYAVIETNGTLSAALRPEKEPARLADLQLKVTHTNATIPFVLDGQVLEDNLRWCGKDRAWLERTAQANTLLPEEILLLIGNETEDYFLLKKENRRAGGSH